MPAYGRGGAGNIEAAITPVNNIISKDLEKNQSEAENYLDARTNLADYAGKPHDSLHNQQYAHMGRGGAGNYYSPWELQMRGEFTGAGTSHVLGDGTPQPKSQETESQGGLPKVEENVKDAATGYRGRGGAGNYSFGVSESEERAIRKKIEDEKNKKETLRNNIEKGVEEGLARPEKARLPGGEPF